MKIYLVGGAVRDMLMGLEPKDRDYVVVGSSPEEMVSLGYKQVGLDFPVFLHPITGEEYALARTERKVGVGYNGFETAWKDVTLEEDLLRRDLTINAIAYDLENNVYIDPYNGIADIQAKLLRPVSEAFKEDPIRVLRAGRFLARYPDFRPSHKLIQYSWDVVDEIKHCSAERLWLEIEKAISEIKPSSFFKWVSDFYIFPILSQMKSTPQPEEHHPEIWTDVHTYMVMDYAAKTFNNPVVTFAAFCHDFGKPIMHQKYGKLHGHEEAGVELIHEFCDTWKVPNNYRDLAVISSKYHTKVHSCLGRGGNGALKANTMMKMLEDTRAIQQPERFEMFLNVCISDARGRGYTPEQIKEYESKPYPQADFIRECLQAVLSLDTKQITLPALQSGKQGAIIGELVRSTRIAEIKKIQNKWRSK
ncbi:tRNA nucleotidyltransferase [Rheinheimera phage vB_RspM_Barba31A]|uniref:tRNA nucleotidyltransferase n=1 Tax=Rheinheimera phage vB_RspM_Barba31A TaxID=2565682 RepID=A0A4P8NBN5_9CAUD|nr:tRNA nucleotidyltransferase [Rheinheimera phage vB_RspM_Barba31A]